MRNQARIWATALVLTVTGAVAACGAGSNDPTSEPIPSSTVSVSARPLTAEEQAVKNARATLTRYLEVADLLYRDPHAPLSRLKSVATGVQFRALTQDLKTERTKGWRNVGKTHTSVLKVEQVSLDNSDPKRGRVPTVQFEVCSDVSKSTTLDKSGRSVVPTDRPDRFRTKFVLSNHQWRTNLERGWRVISGESEDGPC